MKSSVSNEYTSQTIAETSSRSYGNIGYWILLSNHLQNSHVKPILNFLKHYMKKLPMPWENKIRITSCALLVQTYKFQVQFYELRVQRVQIRELRVQKQKLWVLNHDL